MNKNKTAVFIGHGDCPLSSKDIIPFIEQAIQNGVDTFLNGGQGAFDRTCAQAVFFVKKNTLKSKVFLLSRTIISGLLIKRFLMKS